MAYRVTRGRYRRYVSPSRSGENCIEPNGLLKGANLRRHAEHVVQDFIAGEARDPLDVRRSLNGSSELERLIDEHGQFRSRALAAGHNDQRVVIGIRNPDKDAHCVAINVDRSD